MARIVKEQEYTLKRNQILAAAQRLVYTRGYEQMTIRDILADLQISSGAFYHYFDSKPAVLEALIERLQLEAETPLLPIVNDPELSAVEKLRRYFATLDSSRTTHKAFLANLARVWFSDNNAIVREKVDEAILRRRAPLLVAIIRQGVREGVFTTQYPDQAGGVILSLVRGMGNTLTSLMISYAQNPDTAEIVATYAAYAEAIERVLGVSTAFLSTPDAAAVKSWLEVEDGS